MNALVGSPSTNDGCFGRLSDEVVLIILQYVGSEDLYNVMKTCSRLQSLCGEKKLWRWIRPPPDNVASLHHVVSKLVSPKTTEVTLKGSLHPTNRGYRSSLAPSLFGKLLDYGTNMTSLSLVNQRLDGNFFKLQDLPSGLTRLSMEGCVVKNVDEHAPYLKDLCLKLPNLEELNLSFCSFITAHSLMSISKLPRLQKLFLKGCRKIGECLAYVALSCRFGFQALTHLDLTDTMVTSTEFTTFAGIKTLQEFHVGQYDQFVDYQCNYITDRCVRRIRNMNKLKVLDLSGSRITDRSMELLLSLPNISHVIAHFTSLSDEAVAAFCETRPDCQIEMTPAPLVRPMEEPDPTEYMDGINFDIGPLGDGGEVVVIAVNNIINNAFAPLVNINFQAVGNGENNPNPDNANNDDDEDNED